MSTYLLRHNPAAAMLSGWFDRMLGESTPSIDRSDLQRLSPKMDISEEEDKYFVTVDVPGLTKGDIAVKVESGALKIEGERKEEKKGKYHYSERAFGKFMRIVSLPDDVDSETISAKVENGVLELTMLKNKKAMSREIKIS